MVREVLRLLRALIQKAAHRQSSDSACAFSLWLGTEGMIDKPRALHDPITDNQVQVVVTNHWKGANVRYPAGYTSMARQVGLSQTAHPASLDERGELLINAQRSVQRRYPGHSVCGEKSKSMAAR